MSKELNILVLSVQVPFTSGGAELLVSELVKNLKASGHKVDLVQVPFSALPKTNILKQMSIWSSLDLTKFSGRNVDLVICNKFPNYLVNHKNKVCWLIHQHRQAYELYGTRFGDFEFNDDDQALREIIRNADAKLNECKKVYTISSNVSKRLKEFNSIDSEVLMPPLPYGNKYRKGNKGNYILSVGRICSIKRIDLMLEAMSKVDASLSLKIVGSSDEPAIENYLKSIVKKHNIEQRVEFLGRVSDEDLLEYYANCFAVYYAPYDEDYGFVTLEAIKSGKIVVTAEDSGGVLSFITNAENGLVLKAEPEEISAGFNSLLDSALYDRLTKNVLEYKIQDNTWDEVLSKLTKSY